MLVHGRLEAPFGDPGSALDLKPLYPSKFLPAQGISPSECFQELCEGGLQSIFQSSISLRASVIISN
jgi:hypothetical protein